MLKDPMLKDSSKISHLNSFFLHTVKVTLAIPHRNVLREKNNIFHDSHCGVGNRKNIVPSISFVLRAYLALEDRPRGEMRLERSGVRRENKYGNMCSRRICTKQTRNKEWSVC